MTARYSNRSGTFLPTLPRFSGSRIAYQRRVPTRHRSFDEQVARLVPGGHLLAETLEAALDYRGHLLVTCNTKEGSDAKGSEPQCAYHEIQVSCCGYPNTYILPLRLPGHPASVLIEHDAGTSFQ